MSTTSLILSMDLHALRKLRYAVHDKDSHESFFFFQK